MRTLTTILLLWPLMVGCDNSVVDEDDGGIPINVGDAVVAPQLSPNPTVSLNQLQVAGHQRADWFPRGNLDFEDLPAIYQGIERPALSRQVSDHNARVFHFGFRLAFQDYRGGAIPGYGQSTSEGRESMCTFFAGCMQTTAHELQHATWAGPIFVIFEYHGVPYFDPSDIEHYTRGELQNLGFPYEGYIYQIEMATEFVERDRIFAPADLQGDHPTLRDAVLADGWPSLEELDGKFIFIMKGPPELRRVYLEQDWLPQFHFEPGDERAFVVADSPEDDFAAIFSLYGADEVHRVAPLVDQGFIVHGASEDAATTLDYRDAGAHLLTALHIGDAEIQGPGRCNPRTASPECFAPHPVRPDDEDVMP